MSNAQIKEQYIAIGRYLAKSMVPPEDRDLVSARAKIERGQLTIELHVPDNYRGLFIGRSGHMVRSLRHILAAAKLDAPSTVGLDIV